MNRPMVALALGLGAGAALTTALRSVRPAPASLSALHRRIQPGRAPLAAPPSGAGGAAMAVGHGWAQRLARSGLGGRLAERFGDDLFVAETTLAELIVQVVVSTVVGFVAGAATIGAFVGTGVRVAPALAAVASLALAGAAGALAVSSLRRRAATTRSHFRDGVSQYLTLCSSVMAGGRSAEWAVRYGASSGHGRAFATIDAALSSAPAMGRTTWEALGAVADEWKVGELGDLAAAIERATTLGGDAAEAAGVIAQSMRARSLDLVERAADRANVKMLGPTYLFLAGFGLFLAFPLLDELSRSL